MKSRQLFANIFADEYDDVFGGCVPHFSLSIIKDDTHFFTILSLSLHV